MDQLQFEFSDPKRSAPVALATRSLAPGAPSADAERLIEQAYLLQQAGRLGEAVERYRQALESEPTAATAWYNLGVALQDLGHPDQAIEAYQRALGSDPALVDAHYNLSGLYEASGDGAAALRHLRTYREGLPR